MLTLGKTIATLSLLSFAACADLSAAPTESETTDVAAELTDSQRPAPADRLAVHANALGAPGQIALGTIGSSGAKITGSTNWTSTINGSRYEVTITGESYYYSSYATNVTPLGLGTHVTCSTDSLGGKLLIGCFDPATGAAVLPAVAFTTSKP